MRRAVFLIGLVTMSGCQSEASKLQQSVEKRIRENARDPSSIQFRNVRVRGHVVCGEVNGASGMGGTTGFTPFAGDKDHVGIVPARAEPGVLSQEGAIYQRLAPNCE